MSRKMLSRKQCVFATVVLPLLIIPALIIIHKAGGHIDDVFVPPRRDVRPQQSVIRQGMARFNTSAVKKYGKPIALKPKRCFEYVWKGGCQDTCYSYNIMAKQSKRKQLVLKCEKTKTQLKTQLTTKQKFVPKFAFEDTCLRKVVDWYCNDRKKVPNIVHYVWFGKSEFTFINLLSFLSVYKFQNPCMIMLHADKAPKGRLWSYFLQICPKVILVKRKQPKKIQKKKLTYVEHKADVAKLEALKEYGGIYVDTDQVLLKSLDRFRTAEATIGLDYSTQAANSLIVSAKNSAYIKRWYNSYDTFSKSEGNKHSQIVPYKLAKSFPKEVQIAGSVFSALNAHQLADIYRKNVDWSKFYGLHMHQKLHKNFFPGEEINIDNIRTMNNTVGAVARWILYGNPEMCKAKMVVQLQ